VWQYAVQTAGHEFEPIKVWSSETQAIVAQLKKLEKVDLLAWNPTTDDCQIYHQYPLAVLDQQLDQTKYAKLIDQLMTMVSTTKRSLPLILKRQWYLVGFLANLTQRPSLETAAALLSLTVLALKKPTVTLTSRDLLGLTDQANCWLQVAQVSEDQLLTTTEPLKQVLAQLLRQSACLDQQCITKQCAGWQLANDGYWLSQVGTEQFELTKLHSSVAYQLLQATYLEQQLTNRHY